MFIATLGFAEADLGAIWCIGDSITQSNADGDSSGSPRKALYDLLIANDYDFTYTGHFTANVDGLPTTAQHYRVEYTDDLVTTNAWTTVTDIVSLATFAPMTNSESFYRIRWFPW